MKKFFQVLTVTATLLPGCKKQQTVIDDPAADPLVLAARDFFNANIKAKTASVEINGTGASHDPTHRGSRTVLWEKAVAYHEGKFNGVIVPVHFQKPVYVQSNFNRAYTYSIEDLTRLVMYKDPAGNYHDVVLSFFPDSNYRTGGAFSGIVFADNWHGQTLTKYRFEKNGKESEWNDKVAPETAAGVEVNAEQGNLLLQQTTCYYVNGYNYSESDPEDIYYWSQPAGCTTSYTQSFEPVSGGGGLTAPVTGGIFSRSVGGVSIVPVKTVVMHSGSNVIGNISDYTKCFTSSVSAGYSYKVTLCVDQPVPGSRTAWGFSGSTAGGNPIDVGHAFLVFSETSPTGTITRNVGFYPSGDVTPMSPSSQGQLNNDANHAYNVSVTITLTNTQFFSIMNYVALGNNTGFYYNLNSNNCASFVLAALARAGINIPATTGSWPNGAGYDPGDLGEDIRSMPLAANMSRNTVSNAHPNLGTCSW